MDSIAPQTSAAAASAAASTNTTSTDTTILTPSTTATQASQPPPPAAPPAPPPGPEDVPCWKRVLYCLFRYILQHHIDFISITLTFLFGYGHLGKVDDIINAIHTKCDAPPVCILTTITTINTIITTISTIIITIDTSIPTITTIIPTIVLYNSTKTITQYTDTITNIIFGIDTEPIITINNTGIPTITSTITTTLFSTINENINKPPEAVFSPTTTAVVFVGVG